MPKYTDHQIFETYNRTAPERGWKPLKSERGSEGLAEQPPYQTPVARCRVRRNADTPALRPQAPHVAPRQPGFLWYGDGTKLNLYYRDESGNKRTINVYEVVDAYSEVLLGYHISEREDYIAQYHAFRMAIQRSGHKPYELVCDNQGGHKKAVTFCPV